MDGKATFELCSSEWRKRRSSDIFSRGAALLGVLLRWARQRGCTIASPTLLSIEGGAGLEMTCGAFSNNAPMNVLVWSVNDPWCPVSFFASAGGTEASNAVRRMDGIQEQGLRRQWMARGTWLCVALQEKGRSRLHEHTSPSIVTHVLVDSGQCSFLVMDVSRA